MEQRRAERVWAELAPLMDPQGAATVADLDHGAVAALAGGLWFVPAREPAVEAVRAARAA